MRPIELSPYSGIIVDIHVSVPVFRDACNDLRYEIQNKIVDYAYQVKTISMWESHTDKVRRINEAT